MHTMFTIKEDKLIHMDRKTMDTLCDIYNEIDNLSLVPNELANLQSMLEDVINLGYVDEKCQ